MTQNPTTTEQDDLAIRSYRGIELGLGQADPVAEVSAKLEAAHPGHLILVQAGTFLHGYNRTAYALATLKGYKLKLVGTSEAPHLRIGFPVGNFKRRLAILRRIANLAHDQWGWLNQPLGKRIKLLRGESARHVYLTPDQVETLADHCRNPVVATAIRLVARTGLRESELLRADTIFDGCIVIGESKNGRPRLVPVPADMSDITLPLGITYATLRTFFEDARDKAGMPGIRFHDLRHTAASWWAQAGANMAVIRDLLGHANLAVTSRYTHLMTGDLKRASEEVGRQLGKNGADKAENPHG